MLSAAAMRDLWAVGVLEEADWSHFIVAHDALRTEATTLRQLVADLAHSADDDADGAPQIEALCQWAYRHHPDWANDRPRARLLVVEEA